MNDSHFGNLTNLGFFAALEIFPGNFRIICPCIGNSEFLVEWKALHGVTVLTVLFGP